MEERVFFDIVRKFSEIKEVESIFIRKYRREVNVFVVVIEDSYNFDLRDKLLDVEYELRKKFFDVVFQFFYLPNSKLNKITLDCLKKSCFTWERSLEEEETIGKTI
jgi:hypothetical protein